MTSSRPVNDAHETSGLTHSNGHGEDQVTASSDAFDPLTDLLIAQKERPDEVESINLRTLTPFQRALLIIDGTVTKFIEAYTMEPVTVVLISQETSRLPVDHPWLEVSKGTSVIARQVVLQGKHNRQFYAYAVSLLVIDRLPQEVKDDLKVHPGGLGRILLQHQLETRRDVLWYGREHIKKLPDAISSLTDGRFLSRAYRIMAQKKPLMMINEKFPAAAGQRLSHH